MMQKQQERIKARKCSACACKDKCALLTRLHIWMQPPPKVPAEHSIHMEVYAHLVKLWEFKAGTAFQSLPEYTK